MAKQVTDPTKQLKKPLDLIREIKERGWKLKRVNGSHHHFVHDTLPGLVTVPVHSGDIKTGTLRSIMKTAYIIDDKNKIIPKSYLTQMQLSFVR